jgi:hypothetical protein
MASVKDKLKKGGQEITLMTVLANEATGSSRKILKEYGMPDAKNYQDLEIKLAELYFNTKDKVALERKLAEIHPHKNWILRNVQPVLEETSKQEQITEVKSNLQGDNICPSCQNKNRDFLYASGENQSAKFDYNGLIVPVALIGFMAITFTMVFKIAKQV